MAQTQPARAGGREAGLVEAFLVYRPELTPRLSLRFKAGSYFRQTSRENVERLWSSPYTITLSALNTWIGEEVRLGGVEVGLVAAFFSPQRNLRLGVEYLDLEAQRPAASASGFDPDTDGRRFTLELRLLF